MRMGIVAAFFLSAAVFQIVSSSTVSVFAEYSNTTTLLKSTQVYVNDPSVTHALAFNDFPADSDPAGALPGLWSQWPDGAGTPQGVFEKYAASMMGPGL